MLYALICYIIYIQQLHLKKAKLCQIHVQKSWNMLQKSSKPLLACSAPLGQILFGGFQHIHLTCAGFPGSSMQLQGSVGVSSRMFRACSKAGSREGFLASIGERKVPEQGHIQKNYCEFLFTAYCFRCWIWDIT